MDGWMQVFAVAKGTKPSLFCIGILPCVPAVRFPVFIELVCFRPRSSVSLLCYIYVSCHLHPAPFVFLCSVSCVCFTLRAPDDRR
jgi:hypothetical protein